VRGKSDGRGGDKVEAMLDAGMRGRVGLREYSEEGEGI
jgi:hypothetical protein